MLELGLALLRLDQQLVCILVARDGRRRPASLVAPKVAHAPLRLWATRAPRDGSRASTAAASSSSRWRVVDRNSSTRPSSLPPSARISSRISWSRSGGYRAGAELPGTERSHATDRRTGTIAREQATEDLRKLGDSQRLGDVFVHSGRQALLPVTLHRVRGHRDDRDVLAAAFAAADRLDGLVSVYLGHLAVHQHDRVIAASAHLDRRQPVGSDVDGEPELLQHPPRCDLVDLVVLRHQDTASRAPTRPTDRPEAGSRGAGSPAAPGRHGSVNQNVLPCAGELRTPIEPPINSTSCLAMHSPRPEPPYLRVVVASPCVKGANRRAQAAGSMPIPVSLTVTRTSSSQPARALEPDAGR